ncbi:MAG: GGDEF domain-containing protein [Planctomycetota bacterium]
MAQPTGKNSSRDAIREASTDSFKSGEIHHSNADSAAFGYLIVDRSTRRVTQADRAAQAFFGISLVSSECVDLRDLLPAANESAWNRLLDQNDKNDEQIITVSTSLSNSPEIGISAIALDGTNPTCVLLVLRREGESAQSSNHLDALTGLPDRRELATRFQQLQHIQAIGHTLLFLDLDEFKVVNDHHGHQAGDQVLVELASRWRECLRDQDLVVRYGGDEFVILLAHVASAEAARPIVERIVQATSTPIEVAQTEVCVRVTIGIAVTTRPEQALDGLLLEADRAMYAAKPKRS